jgi:hypothetical protein
MAAVIEKRSSTAVRSAAAARDWNGNEHFEN